MILLFFSMKIKPFLYSFLLLLLISLLAWWSFDHIFLNEKSVLANSEEYILYANRLVIFIFGLTVSANIYLYTSQNNISSSIMWLSNQIEFLIITVLLNLFVLFFGSSVIHYDLFREGPLNFEDLKLFLVIYTGALLASIILFFLTLIKFISVFKVDASMSQSIKKIQHKVYPVGPVKVLKERSQISLFSEDWLKRYKQKKLLKKALNSKIFFSITGFTKVRKAIKKLNLILIFAVSIVVYLKIILTRRNNFLVRTRPYSKEELKNLSLEIEIYTQNLEYVINKNSNTSMKKHFTLWNATFSQLVVMFFHIECTDKKLDTIVELYEMILNHHSKLIIATSKSYEHKYYYQQLILTLFTGLAYKEEAYHNKDHIDFDERTKKFEEVYFNELFSLFTSLIKESEFEFLESLQTEGLSINSFMSTDKENEKYYGDKSRRKRYEELFISLLIKMIELNITDRLSTVIAILLSLNEEPLKEKPPLHKQLLTKHKEKTVPQPTQSAGNLNLSHRNRVGLYYAIIKANELENYKAAGYLIKVMTSNLQYSSLENVMYEINKDRDEKRNIHYNTGLYKLDFNDFSYQYCADKTLVLIHAQYHLKGTIRITPRLSEILKEIDLLYFSRKIEDKQKEYNMLSLKESDIQDFESSFIHL